MDKLIRYSILLFLIGVFKLFSQEIPPIQVFAPKDYGGENQNWSIDQANDKLIYIANSKGLLEYNGASWNLYQSPNETTMRSVKVVEDKIYSGCYMEFGYWEKTTYGGLNYTSISDNLNIELLEDEEFWNIEYLEDHMIFQSLNRIYIYNILNKNLNIIDSKNSISKLYKVKGNLYFQKLNEGIFKIEKGTAKPFITEELAANSEVISIYDNGDHLLLVFKDKGFYQWKNNELKQWNILSNINAPISIYNSIKLKNGDYALGTISNGMVYVDSNGEYKYSINRENGLLNNTVLSLFEATDGTIWVGLDSGIGFVDVNSPFRVFSDFSGKLGSVYALVEFDNKLYLGTNQGLFHRNLDSKTSFKKIDGTQGQVWFLKIIKNKLFCGHDSGTFIIDNDKAEKIVNVKGTWNIKEINGKPDLLLQGNYDGLYILKLENKRWKLRNKVNGFDNSSRYFEMLDDKIFVNHEYQGVFKITLDNDLTKVVSVEEDSTIKGYDSGLIKFNNTILYAYKDGLLKYNDEKDIFEKDSVLSKVYTPKEYISGKLFYNEINNDIWVFAKENISYLTSSSLSSTPKINSIALTSSLRENITGYETILPLKENNKYLLGTSSGYLVFNNKEFKVENFEVSIHNITNSSRSHPKKSLVDKNLDGDFKNGYNDLEISYYVPEFNKFLITKYQYKLEGIYDEWSDWTTDATTNFKNLPFGDYTFRVRAKIGDKISTNQAEYFFKIDKPWYLTNLMICLYILSVLLFSVFMHSIYRRYYKHQQQKLIEANKREFQLVQAESEKEIMRLKNEQLEQDIKGKSKELAASAMSIAKKNELLNEIKQELSKTSKTNEIGPVVEIINKSLDHDDNWKFFKEAFNNADSEFLKTLKNIHPNLSPNDLKLCAYLRLNLSSKEIAPLFNISVRSVEIKRYRLRKKMNLPHQQNLVDYILGL